MWNNLGRIHSYFRAVVFQTVCAEHLQEILIGVSWKNKFCG